MKEIWEVYRESGRRDGTAGGEEEKRRWYRGGKRDGISERRDKWDKSEELKERSNMRGENEEEKAQHQKEGD